MARDFARRFYRSASWKRARAGTIARANGLCERCAREGRTRPGTIVHHREHLNPSNINDPSVTLGSGNLELVCRRCHAKEHPEVYGIDDDAGACRVAFDDSGNVVRREDG